MCIISDLIDFHPHRWHALMAAFDCPSGCSSIYNNRIPAENPNEISRTTGKLLVQVIDVIDVGSSKGAQLEKLEGNNGRRMQTDEETADNNLDSGKSQKVWRLTVQDSAGNSRYLMYQSQPSSEPRLGSVLELSAGLTIHRGIIVIKSENSVIARELGRKVSREQWLWRLSVEG